MPSLLDGVTLPGNDLDLDLFKSVLMERCGLLTPLYSEPETMKEVISIWFRTHSWNIERLIALIKTKYAPLENYDRHEDLSRDKNDTRNRTENTTGTSTENTTGTSSETRTQHYEEDGTVTTNETTDRTVAAFNTSAYSPADKTDHDATTTTETSGDTTGTTSGQTGGTVAGQTTGQTAGQEAGQEAEHAINWIHGNIGVMTTQSMFLEESSLLQGFNIYTFIAEMFANDLTLSIW